MKIINLTPHDINIVAEGIETIPVSGVVARVGRPWGEREHPFCAGASRTSRTSR